MIENGYWFLKYDVDVNQKDMDYIEFKKNVELHYDLNKKRWVKRDEYTGYWYPATFNCHSVRAAKRHLRKHDEIPKGTVFRLVNKYIGVPDAILRKH